METLAPRTRWDWPESANRNRRLDRIAEVLDQLLSAYPLLGTRGRYHCSTLDNEDHAAAYLATTPPVV